LSSPDSAYVLAAPTDLAESGGTLSWTAATGASDYDVQYQKESPTGVDTGWNELNYSSGATFLDYVPTPVMGQTFEYRVFTVGSYGIKSSPSDTLVVANPYPTGISHVSGPETPRTLR